MRSYRILLATTVLAALLAAPAAAQRTAPTADLALANNSYFEAPGVNWLVFSNWYDGLFADAKISGIELIQQIRQGTLQFIAQVDAVGHAIHGIVEPDVGQYTHLGDASTKTDGLVHDSRLAGR